MSASISQFIPSPSFPLGILMFILCLCLYFWSVNKIVCTIFFFRFHIYALIYGIYFPLSDLLLYVWQLLGPSTSRQMTQFCSFLFHHFSLMITSSSLTLISHIGIPTEWTLDSCFFLHFKKSLLFYFPSIFAM